MSTYSSMTRHRLEMPNDGRKEIVEMNWEITGSRLGESESIQAQYLNDMLDAVKELAISGYVTILVARKEG